MMHVGVVFLKVASWRENIPAIPKNVSLKGDITSYSSDKSLIDS